MTNEEKAKEIANEALSDFATSFLGMIDEYSGMFCTESALRMAEWKDHQFKEYLVKKNTEISDTKAKLGRDDADYMLCTLKSLFIDEIINELFKED